MPEPTSSVAATLGVAAANVPILIIFGVPLGLRPDILLAGFSGAIVAIILLNTVPSSGDTLRDLVTTSLRRFGVVLASSLTAGYLTPEFAATAELSRQLLVGFGIGAGAQQVLAALISRLANRAPPPAGDRP